MGKHFKNSGRDIHKKGLTVLVKPVYNENAEDAAKASARAVESAIKTLKRRMVNEGVIKDIRRNEFFVTKGQKARRKLKEAKIRERIRREEDMKEWNPSALIGRHLNKKPKVRKRQRQSSSED